MKYKHLATCITHVGQQNEQCSNNFTVLLIDNILT